MNANPDLIEEYQKSRILPEQSSQINQKISSEIVIPVVVHVVYNTSAQNISDSRIFQQIEVLNKDFQAINSDISEVPTPFKSLIGSSGIKFVLANRDPNGNVTNGIVRVNTTKTSFNNDAVKRASGGGSAAWDTKSYLNIWVCNLVDGSDDVLGYAQFPYPGSGSATTDGVVIGYRYFGVSGASAPFNLGRTATHEVGHYLGLYHIWGDDEDQSNTCSEDDLINDTPKQSEPTFGCTSFPLLDVCSNTSPGVMFMNYMDYSDDACLIFFTKGQQNKIANVISTYRPGLLTSKGYATSTAVDNNLLQKQVGIYPNPAKGYFHVDLSRYTADVNSLRLIDITGREIWKKTGNFRGGITEINTLNFGLGSYFVVIENKDGSLQTFKLQIH